MAKPLKEVSIAAFEQGESERKGTVTPRAQPAPFREAFHQRMHSNHMYGLWELASQMTAHPQPKMIPYMWR